MPGKQFGIAEKGKYLESSKSGASSSKSGGMKYSGQSGSVMDHSDSGAFGRTPKANMQYPHNSGGKVRY